jgi:hypothetical protein
MFENPKVSICIPSYNHARFLPTAIESALAQTYKNIEIILTDDGSTDDSLQIAEDYAARHPRLIKVFTHPSRGNRGISATVNNNFEKSTGEYWMGLASDDVLHPHKIAEQVAFMERDSEIGWIYGYARCIDERGQRLPELGLVGADITRTPDPVEQLIQSNAVPGVSVMVRRKCMMQVQPHDETLTYSDWEFWVRLAAGHRAAFLPRTRVLFRLHSYNTSVGTKVETNLRHSLAVMLKLRQQAQQTGGPLARPRTQALLDLQSSFYFYCLRDEGQAQQHLAAAFVTDPTLQTDAHYFVRWLKRCYRTLLMMPERQADVGFAQWMLMHLPASGDERFLREVTKRVVGHAFSPAAAKCYHAEAHWQVRRKLLHSLLHDPRVWRERELFAMHVESFVGSRFRRQLRRLLPQHHGATGR